MDDPCDAWERRIIADYDPPWRWYWLVPYVSVHAELTAPRQATGALEEF